MYESELEAGLEIQAANAEENEAPALST